MSGAGGLPHCMCVRMLYLCMVSYWDEVNNTITIAPESTTKDLESKNFEESSNITLRRAYNYTKDPDYFVTKPFLRINPV